MTAATASLAPPGRLTHREILGILVGLVLAMFLGALDQTIVATALPTIGQDLGDLPNLPWIVTAYLLAATASTPLYGKFSDTHGRRVTLLFAIAVFVLGSVACALAPSMLLLALARGVQGIGGGGLLSLGQTIMGDIVGPRERARYQGYIASTFAASSLAGPIVGGFFAEHLHWSLIFWINVPIGFVAFVLTNARLKRLPQVHRPAKVDYLGAILLTVATSLFMLALNWGGSHYPWVSLPIGGLVVGAGLVGLCFVVRLLTADQPLIPLSILRNSVVRYSTMSQFLGMGTYLALTIYTPVYLETVGGLSASLSGLALIPLMLSTVVGSIVAGQLTARIRAYKRTPLVGITLATVCSLVFMTFSRQIPFWLIECLLAGIAGGIGTLFPVSVMAIQNAVPPHEMGTATACANFFRSLGGAVFVAVYGAFVLGNIGMTKADASLLALFAAPGGAELFAHVFTAVFGAAAGGFALSLLFLALMPQHPLVDRRAHAGAPMGD